MWFNNALIYKYELDPSIDVNEALADDHLKPCPPHARFIYGWMPSYGDELAQEVSGTTIMCLGKEERILPKSVINRMLEEKLEMIQEKEQRQATRSERAHLAEELEFELLPKAFCVQKRLLGFLDSKSKHLIINTASANNASQFTSLLRKSLPGIKIEPVEHADNLAFHFSEWVKNPQTLPANFDMGSDCLLFSPENEKKKFNCKGYELPAEEVLTLLSQGLAPAEISLIWNERIQFTITLDLTIKKIKCLDILTDSFNDLKDIEDDFQQQDASLTLLAGELRSMIKDLLAGIPHVQISTKAPVKAELADCDA